MLRIGMLRIGMLFQSFQLSLKGCDIKESAATKEFCVAHAVACHT
jgi:hypothetical protein